MKILLLHPPIDGVEPPTRRTENLGLGYIAAVLRRDGHEVSMLDGFLRCLNPREVVAEILCRDFDCLGITAYDVHKRNVVYIASEVRKHRKDAILCAGGYFPTFWTEELLTACPALDFVVRGEGEEVASEVFGRISRGEDWKDVPGIAYLKDGSPVLNPAPPLAQDIDSVPFPARDELIASSAKGPALILSGRGCYNRCSFCSIPSFYALSGGRAPRYRSPENVLDEMETVVNTTGIREFVFADDNFIGPGDRNKERVTRFIEGMKARKLDVTFTIECRADEIDEDVLTRLKEVGLVRTFIGIESGVQRQLDTYNKRITVEQNKKAIALIKKLGLNLYAGFIMLDPYITMKELLENLDFIRETGLSNTSDALPLDYVTRMGLYGGMPLTEQLRKDGLVRENGFDRTFIFKDRTFRLVYKAIMAVSAPLRLFSRIRDRKSEEKR